MAIIIREIPDIAIKFITKEEGCVLHIYKDQVGYPTIGIGHLILPGEDFSAGITQEQAEALLRVDLRNTARAIKRYVDVPITDEQYAALLSWTYNLGNGALQRSTMRSRLNREDYAGAADEMLKWCWAGGAKRLFLYKRRVREHNLFVCGFNEWEEI